jgi:hypothetical protein
MSIRTLFPAVPSATPLAHATAALLRAASALLERVAARLTVVAPSASAGNAPTPHVEFHAEAGAPEGALYADGVLVGVLHGVTRL